MQKNAPCFDAVRRAGDDLPLRYGCARGMLAVPTLALFVRTVLGAVLWVFGPPLLVRALARRGRRTLMHTCARWWSRRLIGHLDIQLDIGGLEHIDPRQQYVVTPLHEGFADVLALLQLPLRLRFVARDELLHWRVLGPLLHDTGQITLAPERGSIAYRRLVRGARAALAAGESIVIFPQGTILGLETDFSAGAFTLARQLELPILPVALTGSHRVWEHPFSPRLRYGQRVSLRVLPPTPASAAAATTVEALRLGVQRQLKAAALGGAMAPPRHFVPARDGYWDDYAFRIDPAFGELAAQVAMHRRRKQNSSQPAASADADYQRADADLSPAGTTTP